MTLHASESELAALADIRRDQPDLRTNPVLNPAAQEQEDASPEEMAEYAAYKQNLDTKIEPEVKPALFEGLSNWLRSTFKNTSLEGLAKSAARGVDAAGQAVKATGATVARMATKAEGAEQAVTLAFKRELGLDAQQNIRAVMQASVNVYGNDQIRARLSLAQAVLESGLMHKPSGLAMHNNLFGIKGKGTAGTIAMRTREVSSGGNDYYIKAGFAQNATMEDSVAQHAQLLNRSRYRGVMSATTFEEAAIAVQRSGYATDPHYAELLISVDKRLQQYTKGIVPQGPSHPRVQLASAHATHQPVG